MLVYNKKDLTVKGDYIYYEDKDGQQHMVSLSDEVVRDLHELDDMYTFAKVKELNNSIPDKADMDRVCLSVRPVVSSLLDIEAPKTPVKDTMERNQRKLNKEIESLLMHEEKERLADRFAALITWVANDYTEVDEDPCGNHVTTSNFGNVLELTKDDIKEAIETIVEADHVECIDGAESLRRSVKKAHKTMSSKGKVVVN